MFCSLETPTLVQRHEPVIRRSHAGNTMRDVRSRTHFLAASMHVQEEREQERKDNRRVRCDGPNWQRDACHESRSRPHRRRRRVVLAISRLDVDPDGLLPHALPTYPYPPILLLVYTHTLTSPTA